MIEMTVWMEQFLQALDNCFGARVWFVGLQGSYARGEATQTSDIDVVVILDDVSVQDIRIYGALREGMPHKELICGFLSGKNELLHWEPSDLFQFYYDTTPIRGSLNDLLPLLDETAVNRAIKIGACNIYHGCVHNMLCEKSDEILKGLYKAASFVVQAVCFRQTGIYISRQKDLSAFVSPRERVIVETFAALKQGGTVMFDQMSDTLFAWSKYWIEETK